MQQTQQELYEKICKTTNLTEIQKYLKEVLFIRGFSEQSAQDKMLLLTEEIGELAKSIRKSETKISIDYNKNQSDDSIESEIADVLIVLISLCNVLNIDIYKAFVEKEKENLQRIWSPTS